MPRRILASFCLACLITNHGTKPAVAADSVLLWPDGAPGAKGSDPADQPSISVQLPDKDRAVGTAVVVCPGGGYGGLAMDHEGKQIAEWLNERGAAAFILKYRLGPKYRHPSPLLDVQRAIRTVRSRAAEYGVTPGKIGVWGFSAGGHLASTAATHFDDGKPDSNDPIERVSSRPDFAILCYPVITLKPPYYHAGSRKNLLGEEPSTELVDSLCNDEQVTSKTPPTFLFHTNEDRGVPPQNSILFYQALVKAGVPTELHIYERGPHGVGLAKKDKVLSTWSNRLEDWLRLHGWLRESSTR